ncbi:hypothetical protein [Paraburkholderia sp. SIMBA_054]|uniref:hypothetical protein n=1 Tax=Paraburkholderia sp. SIMBA_054 TaxID=3085795 RepID=UPI00397B4C52
MAQRFIEATIRVGVVTDDDVALGRVEVTVEARENRSGPWRVFVFIGGTDCIFFEPVCH